MISPPINPTAEGGGFANVLGSNLTAVVGAHGGRREEG